MSSRGETGEPEIHRVGLRKHLLEWYDANKRDLPWRHSRDPYAIWISETMLQQTRVDTVIPYWKAFLERFPTVDELAKADLEAVYESWTGLGYYSRARNLHDAAQQIVADHGGQLPSEASELRTLKGIGPYTAGAVASIAFDRPAAIVDGNVIRVLSRVLGIRENVAQKAVIDRLWREAGTLVHGERPGDFNQAMMELGATTCLPRAPLCLVCPVRPLCDASKHGDADRLPIKEKRKAQKLVHAAAVWIERRGRVLAVQRPASGLMADLWELPGIDSDRAPTPDDIRTGLRARIGLEIDSLEPCGLVEHVFTHRRLKLLVYRADDVRGRIRLDGPQAFRWLAPTRLKTLPQAGPMRKSLDLLGAGAGVSPRMQARTRNANVSTAE